MKAFLTEMRKVRDLGEEYILETDSLSVRDILDQIGAEEDYDFLFVKVGNAEYEEIWAGYGIPYAWKYVWKVM